MKKAVPNKPGYYFPADLNDCIFAKEITILDEITRNAKLVSTWKQITPLWREERLLVNRMSELIARQLIYVR